MQIRVQCSCGRAFSVEEAQAGQRAFCPMCGVQCLVPAVEGGGARRVVLVAVGVVLVGGLGFGAWWRWGRPSSEASAGGDAGNGLHVTTGPETPHGANGAATQGPRQPPPDNPPPNGVPSETSKRIEELIAQLESEDDYISSRAARELIETGLEAKPAVERAAARGVVKAACVLRAFRWKELLPIAAQTKYKMEIRILCTGADHERARVVEVWVRDHEAGCAPFVGDLLEDESLDVRLAALSAVILFHAPVTAAGIGRILDDDDPGIRVLGVLSAGMLGVAEAAPKVRPFLADEATRPLAVETLGMLEDGESVAEIGKDLTSQDPRVRRAAFEALGRIGRFPGDFPVNAITDPDPEARAAAFVAAGRTRQLALLPQLTQLLGDPDPRMRRAGAEAFGALGQDSGAQGLVQLLSDADAGVRYEAARGLGRLRHRPSVAAIVGLLDDRTKACGDSEDDPMKLLRDSALLWKTHVELPSPRGREVREGALLAVEDATGQCFEGKTLDERIDAARRWWSRAQGEYPR